MANADAPEDVAPDQPSTESPKDELATAHDTYVYHTLSDPTRAAAEFKVLLAKEVVDLIDWDNLEQDTNRFSDDNLRNHYTDLLFKTTIRGRPIKLGFLLEHSSGPKPFELLQTLRYQVRQWDREAQQARNRSDGNQRLTPIITIILHHSDAGWRGRGRFMDYFGLDDDLARVLRPYIVDFGIVLDDISKVDTEALIARPVPPDVQLLLFALRYGRTEQELRDELPKFGPVLDELFRQPYGLLAFGVFLMYLQRVAKISEAEVRTMLPDYVKSRMDPEMLAFIMQFKAAEKKGKLEGKLEGELEGELKMARSMLKRQLTQRFGVLTPMAIARLESATLPELDAMTLRVLTAASIDEVLGNP